MPIYGSPVCLFSFVFFFFFLSFFPGLLFCRLTAWRSVWVIHRQELCALFKNMHMCSATYFLSGLHHWSDQSLKEPGQEIEFFSTPGRVIEILKDECALWLIPYRRRPGPCQGIHKTLELAREVGRSLTDPSDKELDKLWFHLKCFLVSYQAKEN